MVPEKTEMPPKLVLLAKHLRDSPVTADDILCLDKERPEMFSCPTIHVTRLSSHCESELNPFSAKKKEMSVYDGCVLWG